MDVEVGGRRQRLSDIGDDPCLCVQQAIEMAEQPVQRHLFMRNHLSVFDGGGRWQGSRRELLKGMSAQRLNEVLKTDRLVAMMLDGDPISRGMNRTPLREQRGLGVNTFHVRQNRTQNKQTVRIIDELLNFIA